MSLDFQRIHQSLAVLQLFLTPEIGDSKNPLRAVPAGISERLNGIP
jgi:hypothetical protein